MNKPVAWMELYYGEPNNLSWTDAELRDSGEVYKTIPLYTQDQLEEARKLGMQQERALWILTESTQEFESFDRTASHMAGEYVAHPVKELNDGGEPVKNATYWKRQHDNLLMKLNTCAIKVSELEKKLDTRTRELIGASFYEHDYKTLMAKPPLTDEEIDYCWSHSHGNTPWMKQKAFARAILLKAQEK